MDPSESLLLAYDLDVTGLGVIGGRGYSRRPDGSGAPYRGGGHDSEFEDFAANLERLARELREYDRHEPSAPAPAVGGLDGAEGAESGERGPIGASRGSGSGGPSSVRRLGLADLILPAATHTQKPETTSLAAPEPAPLGLADFMLESLGGPRPAERDLARQPSCGILATVVAIEMPSDDSSDGGSDADSDEGPDRAEARGGGQREDNLADYEPDSPRCACTAMAEGDAEDESPPVSLRAFMAPGGS